MANGWSLETTGRPLAENPPNNLPKVAPTATELARLATELKDNPAKVQEFLTRVKPIDYQQSVEAQPESVALTQAHLMLAMSFASLDLSDADFQKLDFAGLQKLVIEKGESVIPEALRQKWINPFSVIAPLASKQTTPTGKFILDQWEKFREIAGSARNALKNSGYKSPVAVSTPASTLPTGPVWESDGKWAMAQTGEFISDHKTGLMIWAGIIWLYAAFRMFGGEGSKDESKWFSGITDWKVPTVAALATAFGLYKFGPDWIKDMADKFKSFILSEKTSIIEPERIKNLSKMIVEYNNKKNPNDRLSTFPDKLIKSKWGMTVKEFKWEDGTLSFIGFKVNSLAGWLTATSGIAPEGMKQDYEDYQLLLDFTMKKVQEYNIDYKNDDTMDSIWKKILEKEGGK